MFGWNKVLKTPLEINCEQRKCWSNSGVKMMNLSDEEEKVPVRIGYILGSGHCGSTLLSILLNDYDDIVSVSEIVNLRWPSVISSDDKITKEFWTLVAEEYLAITGESFQHVAFAPDESSVSLPTWSQRNSMALQAISNVAAVDCVVDASKGPARLSRLHTSERVDIHVIHLVRDPRAVVHSYDKKYRTIVKGVKKVGHSFFYAAKLRKSFREDRWLEVRYEDLANDPDTTLHRIGKFLKIDEARITDGTPFIGIGGNRMRYKKLVGIKVDDRWRYEMSWIKRVLVSLCFFPQILKYRYKSFVRD